MNIAQEALALAARGWRVIPEYGIDDGVCTCRAGASCPSPGKHPRLSGWQVKASTDGETIKEWWRRWPDSNVGIVTGPESGLLVIDVDTETCADADGNIQQTDGEDTLRVLEAKHGPLPTTVEVTTGSGGRHIYFAWPEGIEAGDRIRFAPALDARAGGRDGHGGNLVAPPARHVSGGTYEFEASCHPDDVPLALPPAWLIDLLVRPKRPPPPDVSRRMAAETTELGRLVLDVAREYLSTALWHGRDATGLARWHGNQSLFETSAFVGGYVAGGHITGDGGLEALIDAADRHRPEPRPVEKDHATIRNGLRRGQEHPSGVDTLWPRWAWEIGGEHLKAMRRPEPPPPTDEDAPEWIGNEDPMRAETPPSAHDVDAQDHESPPPLDPDDPGPQAEVEPEAVSIERRPSFVYRPGEVHEAIDRGIKAISGARGVYQRSGRLASVVRWRDHPGSTVARPKIDRDLGSAVICELPRSKVMKHLSEQVAWLKRDGRRKSKDADPLPQFAPCVPPGPVVSAVHEAAEWPRVPGLRGLTSAPMLRPDGSISTRDGYDPETGYFYAPTGPTPKVMTYPTREDARRARRELLDVVCDFPFSEDAGPDTWLVGLLTPICRHLFDLVPAFLLDASTPSSGKSKLVEVVGSIAFGRRMAAFPSPPNDDECRKRLLSSLLAGDAMLWIDNVPNGGRFGWPSLDALLTSTEYGDRVLSESRNAKLPNVVTIFGTGNNISTFGDTGRRVLKVRLEPEDDRPENRSGFKHDPLLEWTQAERPRLLGAALTLVAAYLRAGRPDVGTTPVGSFEQWSRTVRDAVVWAGGSDAADLLANRIDGADPDADAHITLLLAFRRHNGGLTAGEAISLAYHEEKDEKDRGLSGDVVEADLDLREAVELVCGRDPNARSLGKRLSALRGRRRTLPDGSLAWFTSEPTRSRALRWSCRV